MADHFVYTDSLNGPRILPQRSTFEYTDPRNEQATLDRWRPVLESLGVEVYGVEDVPTSPLLLTIDQVEWKLSPMDMGKEYRLPQSVYQRYMACQAAGLPFMHYLFGEEIAPQPTCQLLEVQTHVSPSFLAPIGDAIVRNIVPAVTQAVVSQVVDHATPFVIRQVKKLVRTLTDPIFIGIIPTGPERGIWCVIGKWYH